jgi:hypothetical protein
MAEKLSSFSRAPGVLSDSSELFAIPVYRWISFRAVSMTHILL